MTVALTWVWALFRDLWGQSSIQNHSAISRWLAATAGSWQDSGRPYRNRLRQQGRAALPRCFLLSAMTTSSWNWLVWDLTYFLDRTRPNGDPTDFFLNHWITAIRYTPPLDPERAGDLSRCAGRSLALSHRSVNPGQHVLTPHIISRKTVRKSQCILRGESLLCLHLVCGV